MKMNARVATWLELAVAPEWRRQAVRISVHAVGTGTEQCYALSMDGRWLCASNGQLTTFRGRAAVEHFLEMVRVQNFELGAPDPDLRGFPPGHFCLSLDRQNSLCPCAESCDDGMQLCTPACSTGRSDWLPPVPGWHTDSSLIRAAQPS